MGGGLLASCLSKNKYARKGVSVTVERKEGKPTYLVEHEGIYLALGKEQMQALRDLAGYALKRSVI